MRAKSGATMDDSSQPVRIFSDSVPEKLSRMARTMRRARGRSRSSEEPAPLRMNFFTGQPTLRSIHSTPSSARMRQAEASTSGSAPKSWKATGASRGEVSSRRRVLRPPMTSPLALTVSLKPMAAPASRAIRRKGRFETPAIGASTRLFSSL